RADADSRRIRRLHHASIGRRCPAPRDRRIGTGRDSVRGPSEQPRAARALSSSARAVPRPSGIVVVVKAWSVVLALFVCALVAAPRAQEAAADAARRKNLDQLLDLYVRNGDVYYRALKADRGKLDGFLNVAATESVAKMSREEQIAFWLNA